MDTQSQVINQLITFGFFYGLFEKNEWSFKVLNKVLVIKMFEVKNIIDEMCIVKPEATCFIGIKVHAKQS